MKCLKGFQLQINHHFRLAQEPPKPIETDHDEEGENDNDTMATRVADVLARTGAMPARADLVV